MLHDRSSGWLIGGVLMFAMVMCVLVLLVCLVPESVDSGQVSLSEWLGTLR